MPTFATLRFPQVRSAMLLSALSTGGLILMSTAAIGCEKQEAVRAYDAPKTSTANAATQPANTGSQPDAGSQPSVGAPQVTPDATSKPPAAAGSPTWTVPEGWKVAPGGSGMRFATLLVSEQHPDVQLTVIPLSPPQPLVENVQRWEGQVGQTPSPAEKVKDIVKTVDLGSAQAQVVDLTGPGTTPGGKKVRMLAAIVDRGQRVWFFKLMGPDEVVAPQKEKFDAFIKSIRFDGAQSQLNGSSMPGQLATAIAAPLLAVVDQVLPDLAFSMPTLAADDAEKITKYKAPKGWEEDKTPRMMRVLTFFVKEGDKQAEVSVLKLGKDNIGPLLANVNRWRAQVGAPPVAEVNEKDLPKVTISGKEAYFFEFTGPDEKSPAKRMFLTMGVRGEDVYFFKITGDAALVAAQKDAFNAFLKSVEFGK